MGVQLIDMVQNLVDVGRADIVVRMSLAGENNLQRTDIMGEVDDLFDIMKNQRRPLVPRDSSRPAQGQDVFSELPVPDDLDQISFALLVSGKDVPAKILIAGQILDLHQIPGMRTPVAEGRGVLIEQFLKTFRKPGVDVDPVGDGFEDSNRGIDNASPAVFRGHGVGLAAVVERREGQVDGGESAVSFRTSGRLRHSSGLKPPIMQHKPVMSAATGVWRE